MDLGSGGVRRKRGSAEARSTAGNQLKAAEGVTCREPDQVTRDPEQRNQEELKMAPTGEAAGEAQW